MHENSRYIHRIHFTAIQRNNEHLIAHSPHKTSIKLGKIPTSAKIRYKIMKTYTYRSNSTLFGRIQQLKKGTHTEQCFITDTVQDPESKTYNQHNLDNTSLLYRRHLLLSNTPCPLNHLTSCGFESYLEVT